MERDGLSAYNAHGTLFLLQQTIHFSPIRAFFSCTKQEYHGSYMLENSSLPYASVVLAAGVHVHCSEVHKLYATVTSGCCVTCCFLCWSAWLACLPCPHVHGCCYRSLKAMSSLYAYLSWRFTMKNWLIYSALTIPPN